MHGPIASAHGHPDAVEARGEFADAAMESAIGDMMARLNTGSRAPHEVDIKWANELLGDYGSDLAGVDEQARVLLMCAAGHPGAKGAAQALMRRLALAWVDDHSDTIVADAERVARDGDDEARIEAYIDSRVAA